jgi:hypothetical protein
MRLQPWGSMYFCHGVSLFDCENYSNRKESTLFSESKSIPVGSTMFYNWEVHFQSAEPHSKTKIYVFKKITLLSSFAG